MVLRWWSVDLTAASWTSEKAQTSYNCNSMHRLRRLEVIVIRASIQTKRNLLQLLLNCNGNSSGNEWILLHLAKKYDTFWPVGTLKRVIALICAQVFELTFISTTDVWLLIPIDHKTFSICWNFLTFAYHGTCNEPD